MQLIKPLVMALLVTAVSIDAHATKLSDTELAKLPQFCTARLKHTGEYNVWVQNLGRDFDHTHHYCFGLNDLNRYYLSRTARDKKFHLKNAIGNFTYMVTHAKPTYVLMPDVYLNRGLANSLMKNNADALQDMHKALDLNPGLVKAYGYLADYYAGLNLNAKALAVVTEGLRHNPDTKSLQRRYHELGGKLPYPEPIRKAAAEDSQSAPQDAVSPVQPDVAPGQAPALAAPAPEPLSQPQIGSPQNPYCRFCPD